MPLLVAVAIPAPWIEQHGRRIGQGRAGRIEWVNRGSNAVMKLTPK